MLSAKSPNHDKKLLHEKVDSADNIKDLFSMIKHVPLHIIQNMMHQQIQSLDNNSTKYLLYESTPINEILSDDLIKYILSFQNISELNETKHINKYFKHYSDEAQKLKIKEIIKSNDENPSIKINRSYVIHPYRKQLYEWEQQMGFYGPINTIDLTKTIQHCQSGDRYLIYDGEYGHSDFWGLPITKSIQFIGIGQNVIFKDMYVQTEEDSRSFLNIGYWNVVKQPPIKVYFENIKFECTNAFASYQGHIAVNNYCKLTMRNCTMEAGNVGICASTDSCLDIANCQFVGGSAVISLFSTTSDVYIRNCIFRDGGNETELYQSAEMGCIKINCFRNPDWKLKLNCIGNVFVDNYCYPIAEIHNDANVTYNTRYARNIDQYLLKDNELRGYNGTDLQEIGNVNIDDANKIYFHAVAY